VSGTGSPPPPPEYSKAYERFVKDDDDLTGMLAYALYKAHVREARLNGRPLSTAERNPTSHELEAFRGRAERHLAAFAESIIEQALPGAVDEEFGDELKALKSEIMTRIDVQGRDLKDLVEKKTGFWSSVWVNFIGWLFTLIVTVAVVLSGAGDWLKR
jgi:hypothetical protein